MKFTELSRKCQQSVIYVRYAEGLKIALITETFAPEVNGVAMTLGRLSAGLQSEGCQVSVVVPRRADRHPSAFAHELITVPGLPIPGYRDLRFGLPAGHKLKRLWSVERPNLVHVATEGPLGWSAVRAAISLQIPLVTSYHTNFASYSRHYRIGLLGAVIDRWLRSVHGHARLTWVPSPDVRSQLKSKGYGRVEVLGRGVDTALFGPHQRNESLRASWGCSPETPVALYVGRLAGEKNLPLTIQAWRVMREQLPTLKLVLVGDGPLRAALEQQVPDAHFAGMQTGVALAEHYASADAFLFGSSTETFGNVVTEAMASGLCVLAYDYAAPGRYIQHSINGYLAPFEDVDVFLQTAATMAMRRQNWTAMGELARRSVSDLSWNTIVRSYLQHVQTLS